MTALDLSAFDAGAGFYKALSDPLRLCILRVLAKDSFGVGELCDITQVKQSALSHHLKILSQAGLVAKRREGNSIFYRRESLLAFKGNDAQTRKAAFASIDQTALDDVTREKIHLVHTERAQASEIFFSQQSADFKEQQDLIAPFEIYGAPAKALLDSLSLESCQNAIEIGPGAGEFLPTLAKRFDSVIAIDTSDTMLESAKAFCHKHAANEMGKLKFFHGKLSEFKGSKNADLIAMHMVMHHLPSPSEILADAAKQISKGGYLLVSELCEHQQEWAKQACADTWLGFSPQTLVEWANAVGFSHGHESFLALRNGFQIQLQLFKKN